MGSTDDFHSFRSAVEAAAQDDYALLHKEIRLYLESSAIAKERVLARVPGPAERVARP
jgi:hypothetical protein